MNLARLVTRMKADRPYSRHAGNWVIAAESDRGRIINSAAVRRLQQKTQVFPLERNAAVRSRLTHSLEVQQNGRYITREIGERLKRGGHFETLTEQGSSPHELFRVMESCVEMACIMHDIGNPPFGHFGEAAISSWFATHNDELFANFDEPDAADIKNELQSFEGNAQAIRLIHSLMGLNLTYTQIAAVLKYTRLASQPKPSKDDPLSYLGKKPGYYLAEQALINDLYQVLELPTGHRHFLSYIMEAADDISYGIADLEDAVEKHVLNREQVAEGIREHFSRLGGDPDQAELLYNGKAISVNDILKKANQYAANDSIDTDNQFFIWLRVYIHNILVNHAAQRFIDNFDAVVDGHFNEALLEDDSPAHRLSEALQNLALNRVFNQPEVEQQELRGHTIILGLLDIYAPLLKLSREDFQGLVREEAKIQRVYPLASRLCHKLSGKHVRAYVKATDADVSPLWERYYRCRLIQDYISGMTDQFAYDEYRSLRVID
ncbi:MAG: dGTPase [Idiomarina sp. T82-3]|uniref:dGTPase n=2 Tax=Idiomarina TaxID=135575 RepID=UPI000791E6AE|nr:dGTPase [Idiomarina sp. T82-3]KXS34563.1 MAG: dGTPase [Idiomarina sp. T82-3]